MTLESAPTSRYRRIDGRDAHMPGLRRYQHERRKHRTLGGYFERQLKHGSNNVSDARRNSDTASRSLPNSRS